MNPYTIAARKIELAISRYEKLSILPSIAARFFTQLDRMELTPAILTELVTSDPAFLLLVLRLCRGKGVIFKQAHTVMDDALAAVSLREIRDALLSAKIYGSISEEQKTEPVGGRASFRRELTRHSLAVACCAEELAKLTTPPIDTLTARLAGLFHDIGKFLLDEAMPKSFDMLLEQAKARKTDFVTLERENLGTDHAILGKRVAQELRLPGDIILGIWLHHSRTPIVSQTLPQARIAGIVELADSIVRRSGIGDSGSYSEVSTEEIAASFGLTVGQVTEVERSLPELVNTKTEAAGLALLRPGWAYSESIRALAEQLARESSKLLEQSETLLQNASQFEFVRDMLPKINSNTTVLKLAEDFARCWQRFYHTGPVCVYMTGPDGSKTVEAVVIKPDAKQQAEAETVVVDVPEGVNVTADVINLKEKMDSRHRGNDKGYGGNDRENGKAENFAVVDAGVAVDWLLDQLDVDFDPQRTKLAPLINDGKTLGGVIFELRHPASGDISQKFASAARLAAVSLDLMGTISNQQWFAESFAQLLNRPVGSEQETGTSNIKSPTINIKQTKETEALAEMAAGAAHELNNPLAVIKGRAQLLASAETDEHKKQTLELIEQNAGEISAIIDDLMSYARPQQPKPKLTEVTQIINEAVDLAGIKTNINGVEIKIDVSPETLKANVDSAQTAIALSNIICNAIEADDTRRKPVNIRATAEEAKDSVIIEVSDQGSGMDEQTLARATQPFFSNKPAGRKRGMGLAHAQRLIQINNGTLEITSQQDKGTTVKIKLPGK